MTKRNTRRKTGGRRVSPAVLLLALLLGAASLLPRFFAPGGSISLEEIPPYDETTPYVVIDGNEPSFQQEELTETAFETYSQLDALGRCGAAYANVGRELMPTGERGSIGQVKPTGWQTVKYDIVDGKYLYNRCHLIGYQLTGENANPQNLITGTRYFNVEGMLPFENLVADYVQETGNHVLYRVTPVYEGDNLVAAGVEMEALSVEDWGGAVSYHVFVYNVQPGVVIDYATGESRLAESDGPGAAGTEAAAGEIRGNSRSMVYHCPGQSAYETMAESKYLVRFATEQEARDAGYRRAQN